jgi:hypothetical protein
MAIALVLFSTSAQAQLWEFKTGEYQSPTLSAPVGPQPYYSTPSYEPPTYRGYTMPDTRPTFDQQLYNQQYDLQTQREYQQVMPSPFNSRQR